MSDPADAAARAIRVESGNPTDEELAAVVAVLTAAADERPVAPTRVPVRRSGWELSTRGLRRWSHDARWN